jgi:hypothetical protein
MGYSTTKHSGGEIRSYWPDDTEVEMWIAGEVPLSELLEKIRTHFGAIDLSKLTIESAYVHTDCLYYDKYDSSDYTKFIHISKAE